MIKALFDSPPRMTLPEVKGLNEECTCKEPTRSLTIEDLSFLSQELENDWRERIPYKKITRTHQYSLSSEALTDPNSSSFLDSGELIKCSDPNCTHPHHHHPQSFLAYSSSAPVYISNDELIPSPPRSSPSMVPSQPNFDKNSIPRQLYIHTQERPPLSLHQKNQISIEKPFFFSAPESNRNISKSVGLRSTRRSQFAYAANNNPIPQGSGLEHQSFKPLVMKEPYPAILPKMEAPSPYVTSNEMKMDTLLSIGSIISLELVHKDLWNLFYKNRNEMIITRFGRCLFPSLRFKLNILKPHLMNSILKLFDSHDEPMLAFGLQLLKTSPDKLKYRQGVWAPGHTFTNNRDQAFQKQQSSSGYKNVSSSPGPSQSIYWHPSGIQSISFWTKYGLSFLDAKLTNGKKTASGVTNAPRPHQINAIRKNSSEAKTNDFVRNYQGANDRNCLEVPFVNCLSGVLFQLESFYEYAPKIICKIFMPMEKNSLSIMSTSNQMMLMMSMDQQQYPHFSHTVDFSFPQCAFIAVTHYQNPAINKLKKQYNPHAKGFVPDSNPCDTKEEDDTKTDEEQNSEENNIGGDFAETQPFPNRADLLDKPRPPEAFEGTSNAMNIDDVQFKPKFEKVVLKIPPPTLPCHITSSNLSSNFETPIFHRSYQESTPHMVPKRRMPPGKLPTPDATIPISDETDAISLLATWFTEKQQHYSL